MRAVVQRVKRAAVRVEERTIGEIDRGILVLLGIGKGDTDAASDWMIKKLLGLRIFPDDQDRMNRSVTDVGGGVLIVSQFTLYGDVRKGFRPGFSDAMAPAEAEAFYHRFMNKLRAATALRVAEGQFAATMDVDLVNDGPVTILIESETVTQASRLRPLSEPSVTQASRLRSDDVNDNARKRDACVTTFVPFDPSVPISRTKRRLPHWEQSGRTYFITFRLVDSVPQSQLLQWHQERELWRRDHPGKLSTALQAEYDRLFTDKFQSWLDAGYGECILKQPDIAAIVAAALAHFDGERYHIEGYVIMPNHVHVLVSPLDNWALEEITHFWKSFTAHQINHLLNRDGHVWHHESFDHLVRNEETYRRFQEYIQQNPVKAGLKEGEYVLGT
jgi:D-tyrosyl-tRNA(Tyr) deacylase